MDGIHRIAAGVYSEDDGGYESAPDESDPNYQARQETVDEEFDSIPLDKQIAMYDQLQEILYPNTRIKRISAMHAHLREPIYYPSTRQDKPKTSLESQWMQEHSKPLYRFIDAPKMVDRKSGRRRTLHETFVAHRDDVTESEIPKKPSPTQPGRERAMTLAMRATGASLDYHDDNYMKSKILRSINDRKDLTLGLYTGIGNAPLSPKASSNVSSKQSTKVSSKQSNTVTSKQSNTVSAKQFNTVYPKQSNTVSAKHFTSVTSKSSDSVPAEQSVSANATAKHSVSSEQSTHSLKNVENE